MLKEVYDVMVERVGEVVREATYLEDEGALNEVDGRIVACIKRNYLLKHGVVAGMVKYKSEFVQECFECWLAQECIKCYESDDEGEVEVLWVNGVNVNELWML